MAFQDIHPIHWEHHLNLHLDLESHTLFRLPIVQVAFLDIRLAEIQLRLDLDHVVTQNSLFRRRFPLLAFQGIHQFHWLLRLHRHLFDFQHNHFHQQFRPQDC